MEEVEEPIRKISNETAQTLAPKRNSYSCKAFSKLYLFTILL